MSTQSEKWHEAQALNDVHSLTEYAYQAGYHEMGYDPFSAVTAVLALAMTELEQMERAMIGIAPEAVSIALPRIRAMLMSLEGPKGKSS